MYIQGVEELKSASANRNPENAWAFPKLHPESLTLNLEVCNGSNTLIPTLHNGPLTDLSLDSCNKKTYSLRDGSP